MAGRSRQALNRVVRECALYISPESLPGVDARGKSEGLAVRRLAGSGRRISNRDYGCNALTERDRRRALSLCQSAPAFPLIHTETRLDLFAATGWCVRGLPLMAGLGRFLLLRLPGCPAGLLSNRDLPASGCRHNALGFGCSSISPARFLREADRPTAGGRQGASWSGRRDRGCAGAVVRIQSSQRADSCV